MTKQPLPAARFLDPKQVAAYFGVSKMTVYRWIHGGHMSAIKRSTVYRVPVSELKRFAADNGYVPGQEGDE